MKDPTTNLYPMLIEAAACQAHCASRPSAPCTPHPLKGILKDFKCTSRNVIDPMQTPVAEMAQNGACKTGNRKKSIGWMGSVGNMVPQDVCHTQEIMDADGLQHAADALRKHLAHAGLQVVLMCKA